MEAKPDDQNQIEALAAYLRAVTQRGLWHGEDFRVPAHQGTLQITRSQIEAAASLPDTGVLGDQMRMLLALQEYRGLPAADRRIRFAATLGRARWDQVSRAPFERITREFAARFFVAREAAWDNCELRWRVIWVDEKADRYALRSEAQFNLVTDELIFDQ